MSQQLKTIGTQMLALTGAFLDSEDEDLALGQTIEDLIQAAVKAVLPGRQSAKNVRECQQKARRAFARALARRVKALDQ